MKRQQDSDLPIAIAKAAAAARKHKKALGCLVPTVEQGIELNRQGFDFICYSGDVWVLHNALAEAIEQLRAGCQPAKAGSGRVAAAKTRAAEGRRTT